MKMYEAVARAIEAEECEAMFGLMGDGNMLVWSALAAAGRVRIVPAWHENAAVAMADGHARTTGRVALATLTHGPGLAQAACALVTAARNRTPLVVLAGEFAPSGNRIQWLEQTGFVRSCEAEYVSVTSLASAAREIAEAFFIARTRGTVVLGLPTALQELEMPPDWRYTPSVRALPGAAASCDEEAVEALAARLAAARRPVLVAGRGARCAGARSALVALGEATGALLGTSLLAKEYLAGEPWDVGLIGGYSSAPARTLLREADLVVGFGAEMGFFTTQGGSLFPDAAVARVDLRPVPPAFGFTPGLYVRGDAARVADALLRRLAARGVRKEGFRTAEARRLLDAAPDPLPPVSGGLDPRRLMGALGPHLPADVQLTLGSGHFLGLVAAWLSLPQGADIHLPIQFGAIGQALACAIGGAVGAPSRPHVVIDGDGSLMMSLPDLETIARLGLPLIVVAWNDGGYGAEFHKLAARGLDGTIAQWPTPDFVAMARTLGGDGVRLEGEDEIGPALARGRAQGGLFLIEARVASQVASDPYRAFYGLGPAAPALRRR